MRIQKRIYFKIEIDEHRRSMKEPSIFNTVIQQTPNINRHERKETGIIQIGQQPT